MWQSPAPHILPGVAASPSGTMPTISITVADLPRPAVPSVLSVHDRQVYVDNINDPPSGYLLARRWMRNDPDMDVESITGPPNTMMLPRPLLAAAGAASAEPPIFPDDSEDYDPEEAVIALKQHWVALRKHDTAQRMQRLERYRDRLKVLISAAMNPLNQAALPAHLLAAQQQPAQLLLQQQHQQQLQQQQHLQQQQQQWQQQQQAQQHQQLQQPPQQEGLPAQQPVPLLAAAQQPGAS